MTTTEETDMRILLAGVVGSMAYGLNGPDSDVDRLGVFVWPTARFMGLTAPNDSIVTTKPDVTYHEAAKACRLMLSCNPTVTELLWLDQDAEVCMQPPFTVDGVRAAVRELHGADGQEGIVWHHPDGRMAKLKARDFPRAEG